MGVVYTYIYIEKLEINRVDGQGATFVALHGKGRKNPPAAARWKCQVIGKKKGGRGKMKRKHCGLLTRFDLWLNFTHSNCEVKIDFLTQLLWVEKALKLSNSCIVYTHIYHICILQYITDLSHSYFCLLSLLRFHCLRAAKLKSRFFFPLPCISRYSAFYFAPRLFLSFFFHVLQYLFFVVIITAYFCCFLGCISVVLIKVGNIFLHKPNASRKIQIRQKSHWAKLVELGPWWKWRHSLKVIRCM